MQAANRISVFPCYTQTVKKSKQTPEKTLLERIRLDFQTKTARLQEFKEKRHDQKRTNI